MTLYGSSDFQFNKSSSSLYVETSSSPHKPNPMDENEITPVKNNVDESFICTDSPNNQFPFVQKSSTPLVRNFQQCSTPNALLESYRNYLINTQFSSISKPNSILNRKPKVNFHSIDDLAGNSISKFLF